MTDDTEPARCSTCNTPIDPRYAFTVCTGCAMRDLYQRTAADDARAIEERREANLRALRAQAARERAGRTEDK